MRSNNPVLGREGAFTRDGYAGFGAPPATEPTVSPDELQAMYDAPPAVVERMTLDDVVAKTAILFAVGAVGVGVAWATGFSPGVTMLAMVVGLVLGLVSSFKRRVSVPLVMAYALAEGVFIGGISALLQDYVESSNPNAPNIVMQAVLGTAVAFGTMLVLYRTGVIRNSPGFQKFMLVALASYAVIALMSLVAAFMGVGGGFGFYGSGGLGLLLCVAGVGLATFSLVLDFDAIEQGVRAGAPATESWRAAFGLMVTLVWLYVEILRLLAILNSRD